MTIFEDLKRGNMISEDDIKGLIMWGRVVSTDEGEYYRWHRHITTVVEIDNEYYAIEWLRAVSRYGREKNKYPYQPYKVTPEEITEMVAVTRTVWNKVEFDWDEEWR